MTRSVRDIRRAIFLASDVISQSTSRSSLSTPPSRPRRSHSGESRRRSTLLLKEIGEAAAADAEAQAIRRALQSTGGNKSEAARLLCTDYKTLYLYLYLKLKQYGIDAARFREVRAS